MLPRMREHVIQIFFGKGLTGHRSSDLGLHDEIADYFYLVGKLFVGETRISAEEQSLVHDLIRAGHLSDNPESGRAIFFEPHKDGLSQQIPAEKHSVANFIAVEVARQIRMVKPCSRFDPNHETKPGSVGPASALIPRKSSFEIFWVGPLFWTNPRGCVGWQGEFEHFL